MSPMESYSLKWDNFSDNIARGLVEERQRGEFVDVAIAVSGGQVIHAHKFVLSVSSTLFKDILKANAHPYPLIYIHGISQDDLIAILDFMYTGEVKVSQEAFDSFLKAAEIVGVKGLVLEGNKCDGVEDKGVKIDGLTDSAAKSDVVDHKGVKSDSPTKSDEVNSDQPSPQKEELRGEKLNQLIETFCIKEGPKKHVCGKCRKTFEFKRKLKLHIESHLNLRFPCTLCDAVPRTRNSLHEHCRSQHAISIGNPLDL